jgi:hypothetical protein
MLQLIASHIACTVRKPQRCITVESGPLLGQEVPGDTLIVVPLVDFSNSSLCEERKWSAERRNGSRLGAVEVASFTCCVNSNKETERPDGPVGTGEIQLWHIGWEGVSHHTHSRHLYGTVDQNILA